MNATAGYATEMAFTVQFPGVAALTALDVAKLYDRFRLSFPTFQQVPPAAPMTASPVVAPTFQISGNIQLPRFWFITGDSSKLIQFQHDRFGFNWRRVQPLAEAPAYPGYVSMKAEFLHNLAIFEEWFRGNFEYDAKPEIGELFYQNTVPLLRGEAHRKITEVFRFHRTIRPVDVKVSGFSYSWQELLEADPPGYAQVSAGVGALADATPIAVLQIFSRIDLTQTKLGRDKWFEAAHERSLDIYRSALILDETKDRAS